jgi:hypothetical protein
VTQPLDRTDATDSKELLHVPHVIAGTFDERYSKVYSSAAGAPFRTPALDFDGMVLPRGELTPTYDVPTSEIIDFLVATGERLASSNNHWLAEAIEATTHANPLPRYVIENIYRGMEFFFRRDVLEFEVEHALGGHAVCDSWQEVIDPTGRPVRVRAFPGRLVQILAGNSPGVTAMSITRGALSKSVSVLKLPSNDLFTASAVLRTMADIDPTHPVLRSFSAVYWQGGDAAVENILYRPQYFDKIVVWGGESAVRNVIKYLGPGIQMVSFDPKISMSMIGREAHATEAALDDAVALAATDVQLLNQEACASSRFQFVEGTPEQVDRYCALLCDAMQVDRTFGSAKAPPPPDEVIEEVEALRHFEPMYQAWGSTDGSGLVLRSPEPVTFHPTGKVVNVIPVNNISEAIAFANPATQTVGVWPPDRKVEVRDRLCASGVQRVVALGQSDLMMPGLPHDGFIPLHRFVNWVADEG